MLESCGKKQRGVFRGVEEELKGGAGEGAGLSLGIEQPHSDEVMNESKYHPTIYSSI